MAAPLYFRVENSDDFNEAASTIAAGLATGRQAAIEVEHPLGYRPSVESLWYSLLQKGHDCTVELQDVWAEPSVVLVERHSSHEPHPRFTTNPDKLKKSLTRIIGNMDVGSRAFVEMECPRGYFPSLSHLQSHLWKKGYDCKLSNPCPTNNSPAVVTVDRVS